MPNVALSPADGIVAVDWPAPANVRAFYTTRAGGVSGGAYTSFNLGLHVGDDPDHVRQNRQRLLAELDGLDSIAWLDQVHGTTVFSAELFAAKHSCEQPPAADAGITRQKQLACVVMTADCLPVLFCDKHGKQVAAAHAGWRGLVNGVLENTLAAFAAPAGDIMAWLGPAIGPGAFEVGSEVREAFLAHSADPATELAAFIANPAKPGHFHADLYQLARLRLQRAGVAAIYGGGLCTYSDSQQFYSYRREPVTGRMASLIYLRD